MELVKARRGINRFGVRKYAKLKSSKTRRKYTVGKVRIRYGENYKYICSCPDFFFRQRTCKHIRQFKKEEDRAS